MILLPGRCVWQEILASVDDLADTEVEEHWQAEVERRANEVLAGHAEFQDADVVHERLTARLQAMPR